MDSRSMVIVGVTAGYLIACLVVGMLPGKKTSDSATGYVAGDRSLGLLVMYFIMGATVFSAFAFLGGPGWAYSRGAAAFYILGYGALGFLPLYFLGPMAARAGRKHGYVTQAEMVADRFQFPLIAGWMALLSVVAFVPYLALQMKGAGYVVEMVTEGVVPSWAGAAIVYGTVLIYVMYSGVLGVGWTNTFQGIFMIILAWGLGLLIPYQLYGGVGEMFQRIAEERPELLAAPGLDKGGNPWPWSEYASAIIISMVGFSAWPHLFMKVFTAKDDRTIRRTMVLYPTFQLVLVPLFLIGFAGVLFVTAPERPDQILPHLLMNMDLPALPIGLFCAGALAASMSSGDAMAHAAASIAVRDGVVTAGGKSLTPTRERRWIRWTLLAVMLLSYLVAVVYQGSLVQLLLSSFGAVVQFSPALLATLCWNRVDGRAVLVGMVLGSVVTLIYTLLPAFRPWAVHPGIFGLIVNVVFLVGLSRWWPGSPARDLKEWMGEEGSSA